MLNFPAQSYQVWLHEIIALIYSMLGDQLFPMIWNAVSHLENLGFIVLALCCDGLSSNRKFFRLHDAGSKTPVNKVINPYAHDGDRRYIWVQSHQVTQNYA